MAREHARILCSIWRPDSDFRDRSPEAQRLYFLLLSQRELNNAGVMPVMVSKWARCSAGTNAGDVEKALAELVEHRYVVVDWDTEELLIRSFMRNDGILKHPYTRRSAIRSAEQIESQALRREAARELVRTGHPEGVEAAMRLDPTCRPDPIGTTDPDPVESTTPTTRRDGIETTGPDGIDPAKGVGRGREKGKGVTSEGGQVGGEDAKPPAPNLDPDNPRCGRHADIPAGDPGPNCRACRDVRLTVERAATTAVDTDRAVRDAWRAAVEACDDCDENGKIELADGSLARHHEMAAS